jgi:hypothetical protein
LANNYYGKLGISFTTNIHQIKSAYVKLAKEHHPVSCYYQHSKPKQAKTMEHLNKAYEILVDPIKKDEYDFMSSPASSPLPPQPPKSNHSKSHSLPIQKHHKITIMMIAIVVFVPIILLSFNPIETNAQDRPKTPNSTFAPLTQLAPLNTNSTLTTKN